MSWASTPGVRRSMLGNSRSDTKPEMQVRRLLHASGMRFRVQYSVPGNRRRKIDIAFPRQRIAVYIDGCFWHGCLLHRATVKNNAEYWSQKFERNRVRDDDTDRHLAEQGWRVLRFWEHEVDESIVAAIRRAHREHGGTNPC